MLYRVIAKNVGNVFFLRHSVLALYPPTSTTCLHFLLDLCKTLDQIMEWQGLLLPLATCVDVNVSNS